MKRLILLPALAFVTASCQPAPINVTVCEQAGEVAFALADIDDVFTSFTPRPDRVWVGEDRGEDAEGTRLKAVWAASLPGNSDIRPEMSLLVYGQDIQGWETETPAVSLEPGIQYDVTIEDGEHSGGALFQLGELPVCGQG